MEVPNPLARFPSKRPNSTLKAFFSSSVASLGNKQELSADWLNQLHLDPSFGIQGKGSQASIRRTYRRIESSSLFVPPKADDAKLSDLVEHAPVGHRNLVLVEAKRMDELLKYEQTLRNEKKRLEAQCLLVTTNEIGAKQSLNIPIPATRMAVHSACETEMRQAASKIHELNNKWTQFAKQNHYDRDQFSTSGPNLQQTMSITMRLMRLQRVQNESAEWLLKKDRDQMMFEDDVSRWTNQYQMAQARKLDYDRYYILANRYGVWDEERFYVDSTPGYRYWKLVTRGAVGLQRLWVRYWTIACMKRYHAAIRIQTAFRCHYKYRTLNPIMRLRMKVGRRAMFYFCMGKWREYVVMTKQIKDILNFWRDTSDKRCFAMWKVFTREGKQKKENTLRKFILRMKNQELAGIFMTWVHWLQRRKNTKRFLRGVFICPQFAMWIEYVAREKLRRKLAIAVTAIQALARRIIGRRRFLHAKACVRKIEHFTLMVLAKKRVRIKRLAAFESGFCAWKPGELAKLHEKSTENERRRLVRQQQVIQDAELKALSDFKKHLKTHNGELQIYELSMDIKQGLYSASEVPNKKTVSASEALKNLAVKELTKKCKHVSRCFERHEFNVKTPPFIKCADPKCAAVFTSVDQYHMHVRSSKIHQDRSLLPKWLQKSAILSSLGPARSGSPGSRPVTSPGPKSVLSRQDSAALDIVSGNLQLFSYLHVQLKHREGYKLLRNYFCRLYGEGGDGRPALVHCLDMWTAIQDLRKTSLYVENLYNNKIWFIYSTFLAPDCPKPLPMKGTLEIMDNSSQLHSPAHSADADGLASLQQPQFEQDQARSSKQSWESSFIAAIRNISKISAQMMLHSTSSIAPMASSSIGSAAFAPRVTSVAVPSTRAIDNYNNNNSNGRKFGSLLSSSSSPKNPKNQIAVETTVEDERSEFMIAEDKIAAEEIENTARKIMTAKEASSQSSKSQYILCRARMTLWRRLMRLEPETFEKWTDELRVIPDVFDVIEWFCFRKLFSVIVCDYSYTKSEEYLQYLELCEADVLNKEKTLRLDYSQHCKLELQRWTSHFKFVEMAISRKVEDILYLTLGDQLNAIIMSFMLEAAVDITAKQSEREQVAREGRNMVIDEAVDWCMFNVVEEVYESYAKIMIQQMWERADMRKLLLIFIGVVEDKFKKKILVDMEVSKRAQQAAFNEFMSMGEKKRDPNDKISALLL